jgi:hypothetical protein
MAAPPASASHYDVELVSIPPPPPKRSAFRDVLMIGIGMALMLFALGFCTVGWFVVNMFRGE